MTPRAATIAPDMTGNLGSWLVLLATITFAVALYFAYPSDLGVKVGAMTLVAAVSTAVVRFDITHPYVWFGGALLLYSVSGPLLVHLGIHPYAIWGGWEIASLDFNGAMNLQFLGFVVALLAIGPARRPLHTAATAAELQPFFHGAFVICILGLLMGMVSVYEIVYQGFTERTQYAISGGALSRFSFGFNILATALGVYTAKQLNENRISMAAACALFTVVAGILVIGAIGQRHFLFRTGIILVFAYHLFHRPLSMRMLFLIVLTALVAGSVLSGYKMALLVEQAGLNPDLGFLDKLQESIALRNPSLLLDPVWLRYIKLGIAAALGTEAMTPGNNMAMMLSRVPHDLPYFAGATVPTDIARAVLPGFLVANLLDSTGALYNELVFPENTAQGGGVGFSIIGYGYIHFGIAGVVATMALVGVAMRLIYTFASRSALGILFFMGFVPVGVYIARNDLTAPLSQGLKHVLLPLILMLVVSTLLGHRGPAADRRAGIDRRAEPAVLARHLERERRRAAERRNNPTRRRGKRTGATDRATP
ncbi:MAG: O-antigen polysaccharide polymerase Wzy [Alphaproteobacteria bacterium]|nr:O-antigen polysaccharide polymerase Wzy [Alphaproteobacteria bacterium]